jgi:putative ABC transport system permease protein
MVRRLVAYISGLVRRRRVEREVDDELRFHLEMEAEANRARGLSPGEARRAALRDLGGLTQTRESVRSIRMTWVDGTWQDVRYAFRLLRRQPGFTAGALATLALGIGATTAVASAVYGVLLRPLPVKDERTLLVGYATREGMTRAAPVAFPTLQAWRQSGVFAELAGVSGTRLDLPGETAERIDAQQVTDNFFQVLGMPAAIGRVFSEADHDALDIPAVLSDPLWRARFGADRSVIGRPLTLGQLTVRIVGVMPPGFETWRKKTQLWLPAERTIEPKVLSSIGYQLFTPIGRVAGGARLVDTSRLNAASEAVDRERKGAGVRVVSLRDDVSSPRLSRLLIVLVASAGLTWLVICANLSSLLLARGPGRASELAVRLAVGASRGRVIGQLLLESAALAIPGGALGVWIAQLSLRALVAMGPVGGLDPMVVRLDWPVVLFSLGLTLATAVACGLAAALIVSRATLVRGGGQTTTSRASHRLSAWLVATEIAVSLVVLVGAGLLVKSVDRIARVAATLIAS